MVSSVSENCQILGEQEPQQAEVRKYTKHHSRTHDSETVKTSRRTNVQITSASTAKAYCAPLLQHSLHRLWRLPLLDPSVPTQVK